MVIPRCTPHQFSVEKGYEHYWLAFGGSKASELLETYGVSSVKNGIYEVCSPEYLSRLFGFVFESCSDTREGEKMAVGMLSSVLFLVEMGQGKTDGFQETADYAVRAARFIEKNCHRSLTMKQVSDYVRISEKHLCRVFKRRFQMPPHNYLVKVRMEKAKGLLLKTDLTVKEIAASVGYSSQLDFSRMFVRFYGSCPTALRNVQKNPETPRL